MSFMIETSVDAEGNTTFAAQNSVARLRYFLGQLLTERDLLAEQTFHLVLQRLAQRESFGAGTVAGLEVRGDPAGDLSSSVVIAPGLAVDPDGRELILEKDLSIPIAEPELTPADPDPNLPSGTPEALANAVSDRFFDAPILATDITDLETQLRQLGYLPTSSTLPDLANELDKIPVPPAMPVDPPFVLKDWLLDRLVATTFVGLRFREIGDLPRPAVADAACCGNTACFPSRTQEGVFVVASAAGFPPVASSDEARRCLESAVFDVRDAGGTVTRKSVLCACVTRGFSGVPAVGNRSGVDLPVVPLAVVAWRRFPKAATPRITLIDNCRIRPLALGGPLLRAADEVLGAGGIDQIAPRVIELDPAPGGELTQSETSSGFTWTATTNANMTNVAAVAAGWEIRFYPDVFTGGNTAGLFRSDLNGGVGPRGTTVLLAVNQRHITITLSGGTLPLSTGTYVFRLLNESSPALKAASNNVKLDGEVHSPVPLPSGDDAPGGIFEARFVVKGDT